MFCHPFEFLSGCNFKCGSDANKDPKDPIIIGGALFHATATCGFSGRCVWGGQREMVDTQ